MRSAVALSVFSALLGADSTQAKSLWSSKPATFGPQSSDDYILKTGYPVGNGKLGAIPFGPPGAEKMVLNVDSLWAGGPFQSSDYTGGNPSSPKYPALAGIREFIFQNGTGNVTALLGSGDYYGSYQTLGNLSTAIEGVSDFADYRRSLDLTTGIHATSFRSGGTHFSTTLFCSYPDQVCVYRIAADAALPTVAVHFENDLLSADLVNRTCNDNDDGSASLEGITQAGPPEGMKFRATVRVAGGHVGSSSCSDGRLVVPSDETRRSVTFVIGAGTDYDQKHGNAASRYSFKGRDPRAYVEGTTSAAASRSYETLESRHVDDYRSLQGRFTLQLPDPHNSSATETAALFSRYRSADAGDPFLEGLLFELSRHLLVSSSRENSLPANLQGRWTEQLDPAWSSDYHANINLQMNYWIANPLGLAHTQQALWAYMADTWAPRGAETARLLYGAPGWVTHNEMNIFGHTSMKDGAVWANYPAAPAWMMQHVWDNYEYTQDADWYRAQGYPLLRGVAEFWLAQLQDDGFSRDGSLVVNPCNSPEHGPTTFGCAHWQQLIHQVFEAVLAGAPVVPERNCTFLRAVSSALRRLDRGLHVATWGGLKEWKLPDAYGYDAPNTHRHLSHLVGWHPGYSLAAFEGGYAANATIQSAVRQTLISRGDGNADDANAGWAKVWRAACWARLNDTERAYGELRYAVQVNLADNGLSMYDGLDAPFQIDANFGFGAAVLSMLVVDLPLPASAAGGGAGGGAGAGAATAAASSHQTRTVVLGPAIPSLWWPGSVQGLRLRGGRQVDFEWDADGVVTRATLGGRGVAVRVVNVKGTVLAQG